MRDQLLPAEVVLLGDADVGLAELVCGVVALIMALDRAINRVLPLSSAYDEDNGLDVV